MKLVLVTSLLITFLSVLIFAGFVITSLASHTLTAIPAGGAYSTAQIVSLNASDPSATVYYTVDGSVPSNSSTVFSSPITISTSTTLNAVAVDPSDNHTSSIITEIYEIITAITITTQPEDNATRVDPRSIINATFSEPMDESTIDESTFRIFDEVGNQILGTVEYDQFTRTASFTSDPFDRDCSECLNVGRTYTASLDETVSDESGNPLGSDFSWSFQTGGAFTIELGDVETTALIEGSAFEITPDPFDLDGSLVVQDDTELDLDGFFFAEESLGGRITLFNVELTTYALSEVVVPDGYVEIYENVIVTVHETQRAGLVTIENKQSATSFDAIPPVLVPAPDLTAAQFGLYQDNAIIGEYSGIQGSDLSNPSPISSVAGDELPSGRIATLSTIADVPRLRTLVFDTEASATSTAQDLFDAFDIPSYPNPKEAAVDEVVYVVPALAIPYENVANNFILTPRISRVYPGMTLFMNQSSFVETQVAAVRNLNMTMAVGGTEVGFSFGITDSPPPGTPDPPFVAPALFLDIGFVGDVDFSDPNSFQSSPKIDIMVNKTLPGFPELPNGCPDFRLLFLNGDSWEEIQRLNPTGNFSDFCPFTLEPEHFSKFAVGGVKGQTTLTEGVDEERDRSGGGGRSRSTAVTQTPSGTDVETAVNTESGTVILHFEIMEEGSGQLKINANELSLFEEFFDEIAFFQNDERGIIRLDDATYATSGDVFDIDAAALRFTGAVDVTIPYDEDSALISGSESSIRFLHYDLAKGVWEDKTTSMDQDANTVTGSLTSLSPVVAAIILDSGESKQDPVTIPSLRMEIGVPTFEVSQAGGVVISADLSNEYTEDQSYVMIVQVLDENDVVQHIDWQKALLESGEHSLVTMSWNAMQKGGYTVKVFLLTDLDNPWLLSEPRSTPLEI